MCCNCFVFLTVVLSAFQYIIENPDRHHSNRTSVSFICLISFILICLRKQLILFYRGIVARLNKIAVPSPIIMGTVDKLS